ncbi:N-acetylmuramoyl-L-alanine amidase [Virgibacillus sp. Bac330]|uniref:N-acetylmuramoyl-L-alanine amidase family protein n=1 Tax=Virgibacillus sp. Bac330 TaxID=2419841 RepID=UPI000EF4D8C5|nr:N-acetylmuramoyl-L-alanine amidase [Virgibacillus sp. Bac330]
MEQRNVIKYIIISLLFILLAACGDNDSAEGKTKTIGETEQETLNATTDSGELSGHTVMIDPGHGGRDPGSIGINDIYEKDLVTNTTKPIEKALREVGANVIMTRTEDVKIPLKERRNMSNEAMPDAFISIHYNSFEDPSVGGFHTYYYSQEKDYRLAQSIHQSLGNAISLKDRGILEDSYAVLRNNEVPAILLELGFMSNPEELALIQSDEYSQTVAEAIVSGLKNYFETNENVSS